MSSSIYLCVLSQCFLNNKFLLISCRVQGSVWHAGDRWRKTAVNMCFLPTKLYAPVNVNSRTPPWPGHSEAFAGNFPLFDKRKGRRYRGLWPLLHVIQEQRGSGPGYFPPRWTESRIASPARWRLLRNVRVVLSQSPYIFGWVCHPSLRSFVVLWTKVFCQVNFIYSENHLTDQACHHLKSIVCGDVCYLTNKV